MVFPEQMKQLMAQSQRWITSVECSDSPSRRPFLLLSTGSPGNFDPPQNLSQSSVDNPLLGGVVCLSLFFESAGGMSEARVFQSRGREWGRRQ
jgi:hypothetical protein